jgi:hypothetical protein
MIGSSETIIIIIIIIMTTTTTVMEMPMATTVRLQFLIPTYQGVILVRCLLATANTWAEGL